MIKKYATLWLFLFIMVTGTISAQSAKHTSDENESFSVYPNPATGGKVFLSSKSSELKEIEIFDILGKRSCRQRLQRIRKLIFRDLHQVFILLL